MTNEKDTIIFDVDDVLIDWLSQLPLFCKENDINPTGVLKNYTSPIHLTGSQLLGIDDEKMAIEYLNLYNLEYGKFLTPFPDSVNAVYQLSKEYNLVALTKFGSSKEHYNVRKYNLDSFFPDCFSELITINYKDKKSDYVNSIIEKHGNVIAFIDDQLDYVNDIRTHHPEIRSIHLNRYHEDAEINSVKKIKELLL